MIFLDGMDICQVAAKREISLTLLRLGLISLTIGLLAMVFAVFVENETPASAACYLFLLSIIASFFVMVNWLLMRRFKKIQSYLLGYD